MPRKKTAKINVPRVTFTGERSVAQIADECYTLYGGYVNNFRAIANVNDGCKVSYKRLIYLATTHPRGKDISTNEFVPSLSSLHPHSTDGCEDLNANLVKSGVFSGHGFFGNIQIDGVVNPHAAPRYTKNRLSDLYWDLIGDLIKEVPFIESPQGPLEPTYIPLPIPLCLYMKNSVEGLGVGVNAKYPTFSPQSILRAYKENNPNLLEPRINIRMNKEHSELEKLWKEGKGKIVYSYRLKRASSEDGKTEGILFEGDTGIFTPKISKLNKLVEEGKIYIEDLTDETGPKLFIGRVPGARGIPIEDLETMCKKISYDSTSYILNVTDGTSTFRIPLYNWIDHTYKNYLNLVSQYNIKRINKCRFDIAVQEAIPIIADYIMNQNPKATNEELEKVLGIPQDIIQVVMSKPISSLRKNKDNAEKIKSLKTKLKELKKFDPVIYTEEVISKM